MDINSQTCPSCNAPVSLQAKFCAQCGKLLSSRQVVNEIKTEDIAPTCPYCNSTLKKVPKRKTTCPSCKKPIFVKSRPSDRTRRLVTQEQADDIEHEWAIKGELDHIKGELDALPEIDKKRFEQAKSAQIDKYGSEMPKQLHKALHSIRRQSYQRQGLEYIKEGHFGLWRNTRLDIAFLFQEEGKSQDALEMFLEVCYIDLNGPQNNARERAELGIKFPRFDPNDSFLGIVFDANELIKKLALTKDDVKNIFFDHNKKYVGGLGPPISLDEAWLKLDPELSYETAV